MNYLIRTIISLLFLYVIYNACKVLQYQKNNEHFMNYVCNIKNIQLKINKQNRDEAYKKLGTPEEWYKFKNRGYNYIDPKYWNVPQQHEPVCYNVNNETPSPIMSSDTAEVSMFYNPNEQDKYINETMIF